MPGPPAPTTTSTARSGRRSSPTSSTRCRSPSSSAIFIEAARRRGEPLDHVLLAGPPGLGKTSLAHIVAAELGVPMVQTAGPALERKADIAAFLTALEPGQRLLHRRDPPPRPGGRGDPLPGDGGPPAAGRPRPGRGRAHRDPRPAAVHADRRDDPDRPADDAAARPLRRLPPARALRRRRPCARSSLRSAGILGVEVERRTGRRRSPRARAARRGSPTACCKRVRDFAEVKERGEIDGDARRATRWRCSRSTAPGSTGTTARCSS